MGLVIVPYMGGKYLETHGNFGHADFQITFAYNAPGNDYIISIIDDQSGVLDVYNGDFEPNGTLVLTNPHFFRVSLAPTEGGGLSWVGSYSRDKGVTWTVNTTFRMRNKT